MQPTTSTTMVVDSVDEQRTSNQQFYEDNSDVDIAFSNETKAYNLIYS
jgi:hypothetical protein